MERLKRYRNIGLISMTLMLVLLTIIVHLVYDYPNMLTDHPVLIFTVQHHTLIMILLVIVAAGSGYYWSNLLYREFEEQRQGSARMLDVVKTFLSEDEKSILEHLVRTGESSQAEIARLSNMGRVKAHRSVQKMKGKGIIDVQEHGKARRISLRGDISKMLRENL